MGAKVCEEGGRIQKADADYSIIRCFESISNDYTSIKT